MKKERNTERYEFVCRPTDKRAWEAIADEQGIPLSAWIKKTLNEAAKKEK